MRPERVVMRRERELEREREVREVMLVNVYFTYKIQQQIGSDQIKWFHELI